MVNTRSFYGYLDENHQKLVDQIDNHEILGASRHLEIITKLLLNLVGQNLDSDKSFLLHEIHQIEDYYLVTRGNSSRAIVNGLYKILKGLDEQDFNDGGELQAFLIKNIERFRDENKENMNKILEFACNELEVFRNLLLYDYSSTVEKVVETVLQKHEDKEFQLLIAESSVIDGGRPYLKLNKYNNAKITFFPDSVLSHFIGKADCALMGAETFYPDGTGFNTIGSDIVGILSDYYKVPLYFITPMNKLDMRRAHGIRKELVINDFRDKYRHTDILEKDINTLVPELVGVKANLIRAFITEFGVLPSGQMFLFSMKYLNE